MNTDIQFYHLEAKLSRVVSFLVHKYTRGNDPSEYTNIFKHAVTNLVSSK